MITKDTFLKVIAHIKAQEDINDKFEDPLGLVCDGWCLYGIKNQFKDALFLVLKEIFDDQGDWLGWWLYETEDFTVYEKVDGKETKCDLRQPEALYDFLIANKESHMQEDGGSHGEERKQQ